MSTRGRRALRGLDVAAAAAVASIALVALAYVAAVGTDIGLRVDAAAVPRKATGGVFRGVLEAAMRWLTPATAVLAGLIVLVILRRRGILSLFTVGTMMAGAVLTAATVELALEATDPLGAEQERGLGRGYFPSGHAAAAMSLTLAAILAATRRRRLPVAVAGAVAAGLLGIGNLVTQSHYPSDVVGGYLIAAAWGTAGVAVLPRLRGHAVRLEAHSALGTLGAGLTIPVVLVAGFVLERPAGEEVPSGFVPGAAGLVLAASAIVIGFVVLAGRGQAA